MKILEDIIASIEKGVAIKEIRRGPLWTGVVSTRCGLASAMHEGCCGPSFSAEGKMAQAPVAYADMTADELAGLSVSGEIPEASLGMAAINSLIELDQEECEEVNASDFILKAGCGKNVSIIGHFPFVGDVRTIAAHLWVMEKRPLPGDYDEDDSKEYLPQSDVIAISSTTLVNHTLSSLLDLCPDSSITVLLGPTTPMTKILFDHGVDMAFGSYVTDIPLVLENIRRGISFSEMKRGGGIRLVSLIRDREGYRSIMAS